MLAEKLAIAKENLNKQRCVVGIWITSLDSEDYFAVNDALEHEGFTSVQLMTILKTEGAEFEITSLKAHRRGVCICRD
jgi:hypothetical protein